MPQSDADEHGQEEKSNDEITDDDRGAVCARGLRIVRASGINYPQSTSANGALSPTSLTLLCPPDMSLTFLCPLKGNAREPTV
jgi:hypothetical protein